MELHQQRPAPLEVDTTLPVAQRLHCFLQGGVDPYHFQVGDTRVGVRYREGGTSLQEKMTQLCRELS